MNKKVIIIGAGGHAQVIEEIIYQNGDILVGFLDDNRKDINIIGTTADVTRLYNNNKETEFIIAIGNNEIRNRIFNSNDVKYYTAISKNSIISLKATIGPGSVIMAEAVIGPNVEIGKNCIINTASIIEHGCKVKDGAHLSYRTTIGAGSIIGKQAYINIGAIIDRNVEIEDFKKIEIGEIVKGEL